MNSEAGQQSFLQLDANPAKILQYVNTGEVYSGGADTVLNSGAIGSCIVITAFDPVKSVGAMAHVMLPSTCLSVDQKNPLRYAANALDEMFIQLEKFEIQIKDIELCLVGGANVLKRENDSIGQDNLESVEKLILERHLGIKATAVGGFERRTVLFDIGKGSISYTVSDSKQQILWQSVIPEKNIITL